MIRFWAADYSTEPALVMAPSKRELAEIFHGLQTVTHFEIDELEVLHEFFQIVQTKKGNQAGAISPTAFRDILTTSFRMVNDRMMDRIALAFSCQADYDSTIKFTEFCTGMSVFLRGTLDEKIDFCFRVYDCLKRDGFISREEMRVLLRDVIPSQSEEDTEDAIGELIDIIMKKMDFDKDHRIGKADFEQAVKKDKLLLEVFGPVLPERKYADNFINQSTIELYRKRY